MAGACAGLPRWGDPSGRLRCAVAGEAPIGKLDIPGVRGPAEFCCIALALAPVEATLATYESKAEYGARVAF
jgi:hypothetical protein